MPIYKIYGTFYSFVEAEVEADSPEEAQDMAFGLDGGVEVGADFALSREMTEEIKDDGT